MLRPRAAQNSARWHSTRDGMNVLTALSVRHSWAPRSDWLGQPSPGRSMLSVGGGGAGGASR